MSSFLRLRMRVREATQNRKWPGICPTLTLWNAPARKAHNPWVSAKVTYEKLDLWNAHPPIPPSAPLLLLRDSTSEVEMGSSGAAVLAPGPSPVPGPQHT